MVLGVILKRFKNWIIKLLRTLFLEDLTQKPNRHSEKNEYSQKKPFHVSDDDTPEHCEFDKCNTKLNIVNSKKCKYCDRFFCIKHLAPAEKHNCKEKLNTILHPFREEFSKGRVIVHSK